MMVSHIESLEQEKIELDTKINPLDADKNPRGVEEWLMEIENSMKVK